MNEVILNADGTISGFAESDGPEVLKLLGTQVRFCEGYSLASFFSMLNRFPLLLHLSEFLPDLIDRVNTCTPDTDPAGITHLVFGKTVEMIGFPGKPRMEIYTSLNGRYNDEIIELKYFRLESLLGVPMQLGMLRHVVFGDSVDVLEFATAVTLFELIDGVVWELGFHATPQECQLVR